MNAQADRSGSPLLTPRAFCRVVPWPLIRELSEGDEIAACFLVHEARRAEAKNNKPYLRMTLGDATGTIDAFVWDEVERWEPVCIAEAVVGVRGRVGSFQERLQLKVHSVEALRFDAGDLELLLPASPRPRGEMEAELDALVDSVRDGGLRKLLRRCLGRGTELGRLFRAHPAAKRNHHAYVGGLLEHSLSVAGACDRLAAHYRTQGLELDRDLLLTGALLHDIGKVRELRAPPASGYTTEGKLLGHIVMGIQIVQREAETVQELPGERLLLLQHLIASHQGRPEWDSPRTPQMIEALVLHYADDLDAKMNAARQLLSGVEAGDWSAYDRTFARSFFQPPTPQPGSAGAEAAGETAGPVFDLFRDRPET
jgi:3'-5' exoribonuclease